VFRLPCPIAATLFLSVATSARAQLSSVASTGQPIAGISCDAQEGQRTHIHQHLVIFDHGKPVAIPQNVGQSPEHRCIYWLHTHTADGLVHDESPIRKFFKLGQFFDIWGEKLNWRQAGPLHAYRGTKLKITLDGKPFRGNPRNIELTNHLEIIIKAGPPYITHPRRYPWGNMG